MFLPSAAEASDYIDFVDSAGKRTMARENGECEKDGEKIHYTGAEDTEGKGGGMHSLVAAGMAGH